MQPGESLAQGNPLQRSYIVMRKTLTTLSLIGLLAACNIRTIEFPLIYTSEEPNEEFVKLLKGILEDSYNVHIRLVEAVTAQAVIDDLESASADMGLVENLVDVGDRVNTVVPIFTKVLHLFYKEDFEVTSIEDLFLDRTVYIGRMGSATYGFMMDLFDFYQLDKCRIDVSASMTKSDILAVFSVIMQEEELKKFEGYKLYSMAASDDLNLGSEVEGIGLKLPRVRPYIIPKKTYGDLLTKEPVISIATDMIYVVREGMGETAVLDLTKSIFSNRDQFLNLNPAFYFGIIEDFDRSKLSHPLHAGAREFFDRDEPSFFERYAEIGGVFIAVFVAMSSGAISFLRRRKRRKKNKVAVFYTHLMKIKNEMSHIRSIDFARAKIQEVKDKQDKAFKMLINEELSANERFRIYMELSKETIQDLRIHLSILKKKTA